MSEGLKEKVLDKYSARVYKNRKPHLVTVGEETEITANTRTIPGIITQRGCCYAGCKGVVLGPIKDAAIIVHGPIGCSYYAWGTRRHKAESDIRDNEEADCYLEYCFSTDMQEADIVFGGEKKLKQAAQEIVDIFKPKIVMICSTCPVGLIGDDINAVAKWIESDLGTKAISFSCEGYKGVSQSAGHHIANNQLIRYVIGTGDKEPKTKYSVNVLGEYNIGGDGWEVEKLLKRCGVEVVSVFTGGGSYRDLKNSHLANLNLVQCHRSINYVADMMKDKYGIDWIKVNFVGIESTAKALRDVGEYFGDEQLKKRIEEVIADEMSAIADDVSYYNSKLKGKTAALYVGGSRAHHYQVLLKDFGIETVLAGYEFAHRDDYEGREVIPSIKTDADSKNIESLEVEADPKHYRVFLTDEQKAELDNKGVKLNYYEGMFKGMNDGSIICDDLNHFETEEFLRVLKPDIFFSGIKDKFVAQKSGMLSRQLHSYDYSGPYAGFKGAVNFGHDLVMGLYTPAWSYIRAPWKSIPSIEGTLGGAE
ncbi:nitrogenase component I subunit alpha [Parasporobacterium paucivorans]|uniref:Nitrogenase protein alpha chain n=1 Tax=Parasporobacterium paucivorans DSM 15970 TaxID=1122934 RepID=A0A1M6IIV3_9FIRM|nr:nitrogenase component I subunit alpha [Parasporobacterium paucivorans]SHJ34345.1 nitrogenase molybdenum-iron protein alpha chain [Parasporobacterium paucivorans DSM 15970]